jgi:hypothetical protein
MPIKRHSVSPVQKKTDFKEFKLLARVLEALATPQIAC